jgi:hypothetical protein
MEESYLENRFEDTIDFQQLVKNEVEGSAIEP